MSATKVSARPKSEGEADGGRAGLTYAEFLHRKTQLDGMHGFDPADLPDALFDFQRDLVSWAVRKGRAAIFADCGLGKTPMQLAWAQEVHRHSGKPVLVLTPLAVSRQTENEAHKFGIDAAVSRDGSIPASLTVTNYDRLHLFDKDSFGAVVCDESSAIKSFDGVRRAVVTDFCRKMPYRLLCTATAAPNDYVELGTSSEALGYLGHMDMLSRFFVNDQNTSKAVRLWDGAGWRFKGHAEADFWRWVASWARAIRFPSDLGYSDDDFHLPSLNVTDHLVEVADPEDMGTMFPIEAVTLNEERAEMRATLTQRCERAAELLAGPEPGVAWCNLNPEGDLLTRLIDGAVQISGADSPESKEEKLEAFTAGEITKLVTKPKIGAWGLNWQHCARTTIFPTHSYEQYYQSVRRFWRFGQTRDVEVGIVTTPGGAKAARNLKRKADAADAMFSALVAQMNDALSLDRSQNYEQNVQVPSWVK